MAASWPPLMQILHALAHSGRPISLNGSRLGRVQSAPSDRKEGGQFWAASLRIVQLQCFAAAAAAAAAVCSTEATSSEWLWPH